MCDNLKRVLLFNMPFATVIHPSLALGLLKAALEKQSIPCDVEYANITFAEKIGIEIYNRVAHALSTIYNAFLGEWIFSKNLFEDQSIPEERYINDVLRRRYRNSFNEDFISRIIEVRQSVTPFLHRYLNSISWDHYAVVGFTSNFQQTVPSLALARKIKLKNAKLVIVMGGSNCEAEMGITLHRLFPFLDAVFSGESEETFPIFVKRIFCGEAIAEIPGVIHRVAGNTVVPERLGTSISNLDNLPYPDYDDYFNRIKMSRIWNEVNSKDSPQVLAQTSRGCWWGAKSHCTFCGLNGKNMTYRSKSPERVISELSYLYEKYGCFVQVVDNILDLKYIKEVFPLLKTHCPNVRLFYESKVNLNKHQLKILKESGVKALQPGIESLSDEILQLMRKGSTLLQNIQFLKWCKEIGIEVAWNFIWGFPGESSDEYDKMISITKRIMHLPPPIGVIKLQLHRFSPYFSFPEAFGICNIRPHPSYGYIYPFCQSDLLGLAYYFIFDHIDKRDPAVYSKKLVKLLKGWQKTDGKYDLSYELIEDDIVITVTQINRQTTFWLDKIYSKVYRYCDNARNLYSIREYLQNQGYTINEAELEILINNLVSRKLMLSNGRHYLSLAVRKEKCPNSHVLNEPLIRPITKLQWKLPCVYA
jgi:ribosomal peptide maturation radical SAM protein 1